ncbi:hypothetical protein M409DRAFT_16303 [Zasmidium cellare ATCC 36951]|uniref:F-box domain-containing protein n=1 Tax=Zasmidium cellare ATCC 36951 TaxID=1080233 RepID=A0A6A6D781_ZASCE|nr:uncharacterized protein M409DRAFT_16303 [Zasmidium cellare ATCC 36951]KAF2174029.1 hypothetical protein M409DRAFT_16303 [Zasmidium cellare ATCC 36951]
MAHRDMVSRQQRQLYESVENELIVDIWKLSGERMSRGQPRHVYLERLHQLERSCVFPLLKLPPELRNLIYPDLLKHNRKEGIIAHPAILRTCKQLYKETSPMLNHASLVHLSIRFTGQDETGRLDYFTCGRYDSVRLEYAVQTHNILTTMRHVQHITIAIGPLLHWRDGEKLHNMLICMIHFFACLLGVCESLRTLVLEFTQEWDSRLQRDKLCGFIAIVAEGLERRPECCELKVEGLNRGTVERVMEFVEEQREPDDLE